MPRSVAVSVENNFTKGLLTEVTGANSPENSVTSSLDVIYDRTGRAKTRQGLNYETGYSWHTLLENTAYREYLWETVTQNVQLTFVVTQTGRYLNFYQSSFGQPLSSGFKSFSVDMATFKSPDFTDSDVANNYCSFASGRGYLFVAHPNCSPVYVSYDSVSDTIAVIPIIVQIRDFEGVEDNLEINDRPTTDIAIHKYNTYNQGWYAVVTPHGGGGDVQVYTAWHTSQSNYPSNADFWWYYTTTDTSGTSTGSAQFDPDATAGTNTALLGNTPAPKGHYIFSAFQTDRSGVSGIAGIPETVSNGYRPSVIAFYAGRTFYAGVGAPGYSSTVYFSQVIERDPQFGKCYQANDPTSKDYFDLLATDGGTVKIQDINNIIDMKVIGQSLYIFASNGVWTIAGTIDAPFKATDYTVTKVSSFPALSRSTIVDIGGLPIWWNYEGIYALQKDNGGLSSSVNNLTTTTIQRYYDTIPSTSKVTAKGQYNEQQNIIYWLYSSTGAEDFYDRVLVLDTMTNAFYPLSLATGANKIVGVVSLIVEKSRVFKFVVVNGTTTTFAEYSYESPIDFPTTDNILIPCSFVTGYRIRGNLLNKFETNYLTVITEPYVTQPSCFVQGLWDYANSEITGRFTNPQQVYRYNGYRDYQRSKLKMRGNGRALQFKFFNEIGKPFTIVAWAGFETSTQVP